MPGKRNHLTALLAVHSQSNGDRAALHDGRHLVTWQTVAQQVEALAADPAGLGAKPGQRIALFLEHDAGSVVVLLAALGAGHRVALLDPALPVAQWQAARAVFAPQLVIGSPVSLVRLGEESGRPPQQLIQEATERASPSRRLTAADGSVLQLTSGSLGEPRFVERSVPALLAEGQTYRETLDLAADDVFLSSVPLFHSYGCGCVLWAALASGGSIVLLRLFYPPRVATLITRHRVTFMPLVPAQVPLMLKMLPAAITWPSLRYAMVGTGGVSLSLAHAFSSRFTIGLSGNYGSTETGAIVARPQPMTVENDSLGRAMAGVRLAILDERGSPLPAGVAGQVAVQTAALFRGYLGQGPPPLCDGWWLMGDLGRLDEEGNLTLLGRMDNVLQRNGKKISAEALELILASMPLVREVAVIGRRKPDVDDDQIVAIVVPREGMTRDAVAVRLHCLHTIGPHAVPDRVEFVSALPRSTTGKILRHEFRTAIEAGATAYHA
jgi:acyl-coenzyme A synthetase/AMP-(fatty) acid ligase